nr:hypothetical protein [Mycoplasmopsis bovis]
MNLESEAGKNDNVNTIPMNNDEEEKRKLKEKQKRQEILFFQKSIRYMK